jgi:hypothetical protein
MYTAILRLVTGEEVYYGNFEERIPAETVLLEIMDKPIITVKEKTGRTLFIYTDKVIGTTKYQKKVFQQGG